MDDLHNLAICCVGAALNSKDVLGGDEMQKILPVKKKSPVQFVHSWDSETCS